MEAVQELYRLYMNEMKLNRERGAIGNLEQSLPRN